MDNKVKNSHEIKQTKDTNQIEPENESLNDMVQEKNVEPTEKPMKDEIAELIKPIAIHEAKSALYKAKLAGYVLKKGAQGAGVAAKFIQKKTGEFVENRKSKKHKK